MHKLIDDILMFWFGPLNSEGLSVPEQHKLWFNSSPDTDKKCKVLFGATVEQAISGALDHWQDSDGGLVALVVLLDQLPRNIYRDTAAAFSGDNHALALVQQAIAAQRHLDIPLIHRVFLCLPLEHSENLDIQEQCVSLLDDMAQTSGLEQMMNFHRYAVAHRDVIAQFGRFPHRNAILGRTSTPAEVRHIKAHGGF